MYRTIIPFLLSMAVIVAVSGLTMAFNYNNAKTLAHLGTTNLATTISLSIEATLARVEGNLKTMAAVVDGADLDAPSRADLRRRIETIMVADLATFPEITNFRVFNVDGDVFATDGGDQTRINVRDRDWFQTLKSHPELGHVVSDVLVSKADIRNSIVVLAVPLRNRSQGFHGAVAATINIGVFQKLIQTPDVGAGGIIVIRNIDTTHLVARFPPVESAYNKAVLLEPWEKLKAGERTHQGVVVSVLDHHSRAYAVRRIGHYPWGVLVGFLDDDIFAGWRRESLAIGGASAAIMAVLLALFVRQRRVDRTLDRAVRDLKLAKDAAELANRGKTEFLAAMSHELRTPLNAIIGFSEALISKVYGEIGNARCVACLGDIHASGLHLNELVNDILDISVIELGKFELHLQEVETADLVDRTVLLIRPRAEAKALRLEMDLAHAPPRLRVDIRRTKQILVNLLGNAVKFTPEGGQVGLRIATIAEGVEIIVTDTGIGMNAEGIAKALTLFGQVDGGLSRQYEGSGLGLPISQRLAESMGGRLDIASTPGRGTTVTVTLPSACIG